MSLYTSNIYLVSSKTDKEFLTKLSNKSSSKIKVRPNWIQQNNNSNFKDRNKNKVISVGRLENQKNFSKLISFFENTTYKIDIYGEGSLKNQLIREAKEKNVHVEIHKPIENKNLLDLLTSYKFFISTSLFEGNPKAILEAMAAGCVVFALENKNIFEIIENNSNGVLINENTDLKTMIKDLEQDYEKWNNLSSNAINFIKENHSIEEIVKEEYEDYLLLNKS